MNSQEALVAHLRRIGVLASPTLVEAFRSIDRADFVRPEFRAEAYEDYPLPIGYGQTISQPYTVAFMLEALQLRPEDSVLDIGSGSGWTTALIARCAASVMGVERIPQLVDYARTNLARYAFNNVSVREAGEALGAPGERFDKILVSAAAESLPVLLLEQLNDGGTLVIPVRNAIFVVHKEEGGRYTQQVYEGFIFVPLL